MAFFQSRSIRAPKIQNALYQPFSENRRFVCGRGGSCRIKPKSSSGKAAVFLVGFLGHRPVMMIVQMLLYDQRIRR
jgi:hypothetical protein